MADPKTKLESSLRLCRGCKTLAPRVRTMGTLAHHGWRLRVLVQPDGSVQGEYVCPACVTKETGTAPLQSRR